MKLNYFSKTVVGLVRKANEDRIGSIVKPNKLKINIRIVCDGMGGHVGGAKASEIAVDSIKEYFSNNPNPVHQIALKEALNFANLQIFGLSQAEPKFRGMGTTCVILLESEGLIYVAHVGDSRIYLNTDEKLYRLTKDHSYVQTLVDKGEITDEQMETHPNKNQLTRALGISDEVEVEVTSKPILAKTGDSFLLCSDGLNGLINDKMINSVMNKKETLESKANNLIKMAESAGGHDNISVDIIQVTESEHIKTQFVNKNNQEVIDTKTQKISFNSKKSYKVKTKSIFLIAALGTIVFGSWLYFSNKNKVEIEKPTEKIIEKTPEVVTKKISAIAIDGWSKKQLGAELYNKVVTEVGEENYCEDCPLFYKKGKKEPISIHKYRKDIKVIYPGDYLEVTILDGVVEMPEINNNDQKDYKNQYSEENQIKSEKNSLEEKNSNEVEQINTDIEKNDTGDQKENFKRTEKNSSSKSSTEVMEEKTEKEKNNQEKSAEIENDSAKVKENRKKNIFSPLGSKKDQNGSDDNKIDKTDKTKNKDKE